MVLALEPTAVTRPMLLFSFTINNPRFMGGGANNINADIAGLEDIQRENTFRNNYATYRNRSNFGRSGINRVISRYPVHTFFLPMKMNGRRTALQEVMIITITQVKCLHKLTGSSTFKMETSSATTIQKRKPE